MREEYKRETDRQRGVTSVQGECAAKVVRMDHDKRGGGVSVMFVGLAEWWRRDGSIVGTHRGLGRLQSQQSLHTAPRALIRLNNFVQMRNQPCIGMCRRR